MKSKNRSKAIMAAAATQVLWGLSFLASSIGQETASPFVLMSYRFDIALLILSVLVLLGRQKLDLKGKNILPLLLLGTMEPAMATVPSVVWLGTVFDPATLVGFVLVIAMVYLTA